MTAIATLSPSRTIPLPELQTVREQGFPNMELFGWNGFFAPARTPPAVVATIQQEMAKAARDPDVKRRLVEMLALGHRTKDLATTFRLSEGRISQLRKEFREDYTAFCEGSAGG